MNPTKSIILKSTEEFNYVLVAITKEECEEIQALMRLKATESDKYPFINDVEGCAHVSDVTENVLKPYISEYNKYKHKKDLTHNHIEITEFTCYANLKRPTNSASLTNIIHEDRVSSFKCACSCLGAKYFYIQKANKLYSNLTREKLDDIINDLKPNIENESTNNDNNTEVRSEDQSE